MEIGHRSSLVPASPLFSRTPPVCEGRNIIWNVTCGRRVGGSIDWLVSIELRRSVVRKQIIGGIRKKADTSNQDTTTISAVVPQATRVLSAWWSWVGHVDDTLMVLDGYEQEEGSHTPRRKV